MHTFQLFEVGPTGRYVVQKVHGLFPTFEDALIAAKDARAKARSCCGYRVQEVQSKAVKTRASSQTGRPAAHP